MKLLRIYACFALTGLASFNSSLLAQSKLDLASKMTLMRERNITLPVYNGRLKTFSRDVDMNRTHMMSMISLNGKDAKEKLEAEGVKIISVRNNIAIASVPISDVERISSLPSVKHMQLARRVYQKMDIAREVTGINKIHEGVGLPQAYTGKGVVTGIVDSGIDANHINFRDANGRTRIGYLAKIYQTNSTADGYIYENYYPEDEMPDGDNVFPITSFKTDDKTTYHGTHTMGIMAGGYKGSTYVATTTDDENATNVLTANPYYGGATESEIVASCGDLYDAFIAAGVEECIAYAQYSNGVDGNGMPIKKKPLVINLSLGSSLGSHDTKSQMNSYLADCGKEAIICVAAGNEGNLNIAFEKKFTADDEEAKTFIVPLYPGTYSETSQPYYNLRYGEIYAYSNDATEFEVQAVIYNKQRGSIALRMPVASSTDGDAVVWTSGGDYAVDGGTESSTFKNAFDGYVAIGTMIDSETGRYHAIIQYMTSDNQTKNADGRYMLGLLFKGKKGKRVNAYCDGTFSEFGNNGIKGWANGSTDGTISDMAVANNVLSVGSYNVRDHWAAWDGGVYGYNDNEYPYGEITDFSSYGTLPDGTTRPHVCAPGASIISSVNTYAVENAQMGYTDAAIQAQMKEESGRKNYWHQSLGTSMATPVVAGAIALWLEADPTLTIKDVKDIIKKTSTVDWDVKSDLPAKWGAGKFNAYAGLKEVLRRKELALSIDNVELAENKVVINPTGTNAFNVFCANAKTIKVSIYNPAGALVLEQTTEGDETTINTSNLKKGVYLLQANGSKTEKIVIK